MKKVMFLFLSLLFSITLIFGQTVENKEVRIKESKEKIKHYEDELKIEKAKLKSLEGDEVSNRFKDVFISDFGDIDDVVWKKGDMYNMAIFTKDGLKKSAFYDFDSELIGTTWVVTFADLPEKAQNEIKKEYEDYTIGPVIYYDDNETINVNLFLYDTEFEHRDSYFVELMKDTKKIVLMVDKSGDVSFFKLLK